MAATGLGLGAVPFGRGGNFAGKVGITYTPALKQHGGSQRLLKIYDRALTSYEIKRLR